MLEINDLSLLKITKIKPWYAVYFTYNEKRYLLHESNEDYETTVTLYEKTYLDGKYNLKAITSKNIHIPSFPLKYGKRSVNNCVYSQIDLVVFVASLVKKGFVSSEDIDVEFALSRNRAVEKEIIELETQIRELRKFYLR